MLLIFRGIEIIMTMQSIWSSSALKDYNYNLSTEQNYEMKGEPVFVGKYARQRELLDYSYHLHYTPERQLLHDTLMERYNEVVIEDGEYTCEIPEENWLVFTAGPVHHSLSRARKSVIKLLM